MKRLAALVSLLILITYPQPSLAAIWAPPELTPDQLSEIAGWSFKDTFFSGGENYSRIKVQSKEEDPTNKTASEWSTCQNLESEPCLNSENKWKDAVLLLPYCTDTAQDWCIQSLGISSKGAVEAKAKFLRQVKGIKTPEYKELGFPAGSTVSLWESEGVNNPSDIKTYATYVMVRIINIPEKGPSIVQMRAAVLPYREKLQESGDNKKEYFETRFVSDVVDGVRVLRVFGGSDQCAWTEDGICGEVENFAENIEVSLSLRLSKKVTGWLMGRLQRPEIKVTSFNSRQNLLSVKASPVEVPQFYGAVPKNQLSAALAGTWLNDGWGTKNPQGIYINKSDSPVAFRVIEGWKSVVKNQAAGTISTWAFTTTNHGIGSKCLIDTGSISGFVTTNAMAYEGTAPNFIKGYLEYKVAGLHLNPDGSVFEGTYNLTIRKSLAKCLYGINDSPISGSVSIVNNGKEEKIATTSLREIGVGKDAWVSLSAQGFTFSNPLIRVKFKQASRTIFCLKGKITKKVIAISPSCPSGYKKI